MTNEMVIFKDFDEFKVTTKENYFACIRDARKVWDFSSFKKVGDVIEQVKAIFKTDKIILKL